ncbi:outer membrane protein [Luteolibacter luteus]|uniref:Outer membrane beta-barrel protein n=1 Tax=Luteolibacter luteus TaxID=2728835 RepID=A0A858RK51_9BACT|nr:hypothetical protein [Luteolibacter luteus]QJE97105.1 hypothetical protein HHL09_15360 [Luteolibacter luteus]
MKKALIALMLVAGSAMAGTTSKEPIPAPIQEEPSLWRWFIGGSAGYLIDWEEEMYHAQLGVDMPYEWAGFKPSIYLEVGFAETDDAVPIIDPTIPTALVNTTLFSDFQFVPLTVNFKLEREIAQNLHFYAGAGLGVAFTEFEAFAPFISGPSLRVSEDDTVFYAQIFAGLGYDVTDNFEVFTGARWVYLDEPEGLGNAGGIATFEDDVLVEAGLRFTF